MSSKIIRLKIWVDFFPIRMINCTKLSIYFLSLLFFLFNFTQNICAAKIEKNSSLSKSEVVLKRPNKEPRIEDIDQEIYLLSNIIKLLKTALSKTSNSFEAIKTNEVDNKIKTLNEVLNDAENKPQNNPEHQKKTETRKHESTRKSRRGKLKLRKNEQHKLEKPKLKVSNRQQKESRAKKRNFNNKQRNQNSQSQNRQNAYEEEDLESGFCSKGFQKVYDSYNCYMVSPEAYKSYFEASDFCKSKGYVSFYK